MAKNRKKIREHLILISRRSRGETLRLDMQLKRFALFRDDVRDLVTLTVDRSLDAVLTQSHRICRNHWTVSTIFNHNPSALPYACALPSLPCPGMDVYHLIGALFMKFCALTWV